MTLSKLAARLLDQGRFILADTAMDIAASGVTYENLRSYANAIGVTNLEQCRTDVEVLDKIVALEQHCEFH